MVVPANENEHAVSGGGGGGGGVKDTIDVVVAARPSRPYNGHSAAAPTYAPTYAPAGVDHQAEPEIIWREDPPPHQQHSPDPFQQASLAPIRRRRHVPPGRSINESRHRRCSDINISSTRPDRRYLD